MILPGSYVTSLLLLALTLLCWGSWANTLPAAGSKWRFELYYFDFAIGVFIAATICALTLGTLGWDGFSFSDDIRLAGKRQDLFGFVAGVIFNLGNMLLVAAISVAGLSVAFPVGMGLALVLGVIWSSFLGPAGSVLLRLGGAVAIAAAILLSILAWRGYANAKVARDIESGKARNSRKGISLKGVFLSLAAGVFLGSFYPLLQMSRDSEIGLGPYSLGFVFAFGILISTFVFNLFFVNLPVEGQPVDLIEYFRATARVHGAGLFGGILWYVGALATFVVARADNTTAVGPGLSLALIQGSVVVATLWGLIYWKELSISDNRISYQGVLVIVFLVVGLGLLSVAPVLAAR